MSANAVLAKDPLFSGPSRMGRADVASNLLGVPV
jgi:hypothetical protein